MEYFDQGFQHQQHSQFNNNYEWGINEQDQVQICQYRYPNDVQNNFQHNDYTNNYNYNNMISHKIDQCNNIKFSLKTQSSQLMNCNQPTNTYHQNSLPPIGIPMKNDQFNSIIRTPQNSQLCQLTADCMNQAANNLYHRQSTALNVEQGKSSSTYLQALLALPKEKKIEYDYNQLMRRRRECTPVPNTFSNNNNANHNINQEISAESTLQENFQTTVADFQWIRKNSGKLLL